MTAANNAGAATLRKEEFQLKRDGRGRVLGGWTMGPNLYGLKQTRDKRSRPNRNKLASRALLFYTDLEMTEGPEDEITNNFHVTGETVIHLLKSQQ